MFALLLWLPAVSGAAERRVDLATLKGVINPVAAEFLTKAVDRATTDGSEALIIQLDTPGGLDTSMREIVVKILGADIPVIVYVAPSGGRAASAGVFI
ncbi:MAG: nodulation protein NfeD, partial [Nitrospirae bacterium]|nr:nodulation protein NfeD [Nitrospirota bacterium]